jgi:predicted flap endonuclease-1-like 5' DNA nuclease
MMFDFCSFILGGLLFWLLAWLLDWFFNQNKKAVKPQQNQALMALEGQFKGASRDLDAARLELSGRNATVAKLESELEGLRVRLPKLEGFERANSDLRLQLQGFDAIKAKLSTAETELASLRVKASEFDGLNSRFESMQTEFSQFKSNTAGFEGFKIKAQRTDELEAGMGAFETEKARLLKETSTAVLKASDAEAAQLKLKKSLDESVAELARLRGGIQQFEGLKGRIDELESRGISHEAQAKLDAQETELNAYRTRVAQLEASVTAGAALRGDLETAQSRVATLEGTGISREAQTKMDALNLEISSYQNRVAHLEEGAKTNAGLRDELNAAQERIRALETELNRPPPAKPDALEDVNGIGAVIAKRLNDAGINTFAGLAASNPDALNAIVKPQAWQQYDYKAWIEDAAFLARGETPPARQRAQDSSLSTIDGIGEVFEQKLEAAGIKSYSDLANANFDAIRQALGRTVDDDELELWQAEALARRDGDDIAKARERVQRGQLERRELALKRAESELKDAESLRRDRFDLITGIGDAGMRKLYGAGVYLYADLAEKSESAIRIMLENDDIDAIKIKAEAAAFARGESVQKEGE